jgi:hypothetical protein
MTTNRNAAVTNSIHIKRYVPLGDVDSQLKLNPSAKVYREVIMTIDKEMVRLDLASVTREAATSGYRNGAINLATYSIPTETFMTSDEDSLVSGQLSGESFSVLKRIIRIRDEFLAVREAMDKVIGVITTV